MTLVQAHYSIYLRMYVLTCTIEFSTKINRSIHCSEAHAHRKVLGISSC